ncbi:MAG: hypothetical protein AB7F75_13255 [Planctomycetota bacterium]
MEPGPDIEEVRRKLSLAGYRSDIKGQEMVVTSPRPRLPVAMMVTLALLLPMVVMVIRDISGGHTVRFVFTSILLVVTLLLLSAVSLSRNVLRIGATLTVSRKFWGVGVSAWWNPDDVREFIVHPLSAGSPSTLSVLGHDGSSEPIMASAIDDIPMALRELLEDWRAGVWSPASMKPLK